MTTNNKKSKKTQKSKKTEKEETRIFSDTYQMETQTVYHEDGKISVSPLDFELGQQITVNGENVHFQGGITVNPDGQIGIKPYHRDTNIRYRELFNTYHGCIRDTKEDVIIKLQFHKKKGRWAIADMLEDEVDDMIGYLETTKKIKEWQ